MAAIQCYAFHYSIAARPFISPLLIRHFIVEIVIQTVCDAAAIIEQQQGHQTDCKH